MRIISGTHKGRRITAPKGLPVRPTTDRAKEALFNILQHQFSFDNINVLDLYAGIGSISFEFASRGAQKIVAVDQHPKCVQFIKTTAATLNLDIEVHRQDALQFAKNNRESFALVFLDPPYAVTEENYLQLLTVLLENPATANALLIAEHDTQHQFEEHTAFKEQRRYGSSIFSFFIKK